MNTSVQVHVDASWVRLAQSPFGRFVQAFSGVSITFAPLFLYSYGHGGEPLGPAWLGVTVCWLVILGSGFFHIGFAQHILSQLRGRDTTMGPAA